MPIFIDYLFFDELSNVDGESTEKLKYALLRDFWIFSEISWKLIKYRR